MDTKRGDDAQDHAPQPTHRDREPLDDKQDAGNFKEKGRDDGAVAVDDLNSADDEGAN